MRASKDKILPTLKTAKGQLDAVIKMVNDDRYCMDIVTQMLATESLIKKARKEVLKSHLEGCVLDAVQNDNSSERTQKIDEIIKLLEKMD